MLVGASACARRVDLQTRGKEASGRDSGRDAPSRASAVQTGKEEPARPLPPPDYCRLATVALERLIQNEEEPDALAKSCVEELTKQDGYIRVDARFDRAEDPKDLEIRDCVSGDYAIGFSPVRARARGASDVVLLLFYDDERGRGTLVNARIEVAGWWKRRPGVMTLSPCGSVFGRLRYEGGRWVVAPGRRLSAYHAPASGPDAGGAVGIWGRVVADRPQGLSGLGPLRALAGQLDEVVEAPVSADGTFFIPTGSGRWRVDVRSASGEVAGFDIAIDATVGDTGLVIHLEPTVLVEGEVKLHSGPRVPGASVLAYPSDNGAPITVLTSSKGTFQARVLAGEYDLRAGPDDAHWSQVEATDKGPSHVTVIVGRAPVILGAVGTSGGRCIASTVEVVVEPRLTAEKRSFPVSRDCQFFAFGLPRTDNPAKVTANGQGVVSVAYWDANHDERVPAPVCLGRCGPGWQRGALWIAAAGPDDVLSSASVEVTDGGTVVGKCVTTGGTCFVPGVRIGARLTVRAHEGPLSGEHVVTAAKGVTNVLVPLRAHAG
jgi:hypothetical protein